MIDSFVFIGSGASPLAIDRYSIMQEIMGVEGSFYDRSKGRGLSSCSEGYRVEKIGVEGWLFHISSLIRLMRLCQSLKPKVIVYHGVSVQLLSLIPYLCRTKIILVAQGSDINNARKRPSSFNSWLVRILLKKSNLIIVKSKPMRDTVRALCDQANCEIINWGVQDCFSMLPLELDGRRITVVSPRTNKPNYNIDIILGAIRELKKKYDFDYIHVGLGEVHNCSDVAKIVYKNATAEEMAKILNSSDIMISIPSQDGFSTSIMESLAAGALPVISDLPAYIREIEDTRLSVRLNAITIPELYTTLERLFADIKYIRASRDYRMSFARSHYSRDQQMALLQRKIKRVLE